MKFSPFHLKEKYRLYKKKKIEEEFAGDAVTCSICGSSYREFGPRGLANRRNALCFNCGSLERHRLIWKYLNDKDLLHGSMKILHFAPEKVFYDIFSEMPGVNYFSADLNPKNYHKKGMQKVSKEDITSISFDSDSFDFILCSHVLEHIPEDRLAMSELCRVLKPGGFGIIQVPIDYNREKTYEDFSITSKKEREKAFGQRDHVRLYGTDYTDRLVSAGFEVTVDDFVTTFSDAEQFKFGFEGSEMIYLCRKPR